MITSFLINPIDRLTEFRRVAGLTKTLQVQVTPSFVNGKYMQVVNNIRPSIGFIRLNNHKLRELYGHFFASVKDQERDGTFARYLT